MMTADRIGIIVFALLAAAWPARAQQKPADASASPVLSSCRALAVTSEETVPAGTGLAVSPDGRWLAQIIHTTRGAELKLRRRDTGEEHRTVLEPPALPPGVTWRVAELVFAPGGEWLAVRSVGATWLLALPAAQAAFQIRPDTEKHTYPGKLSSVGNQLAIAFWPPESSLADATAKQPVEVRFYDLPSGNLLRTLSLALESSDAWTELRLSPDGTRLAVLRRATRWPGKARLLLLAADTGKPLWEKKVGAEDLAWSADGQQLLALGGQLFWLDARTGKKLREAEKNIRFSEFQRLRKSDTANTALGHFALYNPLKRTFSAGTRADTRFLLWRLDTGKALCEIQIDQTKSVDAWITPASELIALEEDYEVRPPLRLLRSARIVTYQLQTR